MRGSRLPRSSTPTRPEIVWTSGATESINLALKGAAHGCSGRGRHLVTSSLEHKAVLDSCAQLAREGFEITYVRPDRDGLISAENVEEALRDDTILVSLMHVNNEVGRHYRHRGDRRHRTLPRHRVPCGRGARRGAAAA